MSYYQGKHILITGAASGMGRLMAIQMGNLGGKMILLDIDDVGLESVKSELVEKHISVTTFLCDLSNRLQIYDIATQIGSVDILINNAGIVTGKNLLDAPDVMIEKTFQVNILAHFWLVKSFLPGMLERNSGHIVTIASSGGLAATSKLTDYCSSKFAAIGFDESLRLELRKKGSQVRTTVVCPFFVDTGMFAGVKTRFSFLLPILKEKTVVNKIVKAISKGKRRLIMPRFVYTIFPLRMFPVGMQDTILDILGINNSMDDFLGRNEPKT